MKLIQRIFYLLKIRACRYEPAAGQFHRLKNSLPPAQIAKENKDVGEFLEMLMSKKSSLTIKQADWLLRYKSLAAPVSSRIHEQRCSTVLTELWYKVDNHNGYFLNSKQNTAVKINEDALQHIEMYVVGV